jgi:biopolymer transport protein TolR
LNPSLDPIGGRGGSRAHCRIGILLHLVQRADGHRRRIGKWHVFRPAGSNPHTAGYFINKSACGSRVFVMSMDVGGGGKDSLKADINVTPLVDVMLVLLIIMMLIAPMLGGVIVQMPEALNTGEKPDTQKQTVIAIDAHGAFYVNSLPVPIDHLIPQVQRVLEDQKEKIVYLKGDKGASYSAIMAVMDALRNAQIENIALITEKKNQPAGAGGPP